MEFRLPVILGRDFAGTVARVTSGGNGFSVGDPVFGVHFPTFLHDGTFAEEVAVPGSAVARQPEDVDVVSAGALGLAGVAAKLAVDAVAPRPGETVLVSGATGGVGAIAIQLAKAKGAQVIATARAAESGFVTDLGADHAVDFTGDLGAEVHELAPDGVDGVIHLAGDPMTLLEVCKPGARFASTLGVGAEQLAGQPVQATAVWAPTGLTSEALAGLAAMVATGQLRVPVTRTYPLEEVTLAIKDFNAGALGKLAIAVS